jgi:hypothetical protein
MKKKKLSKVSLWISSGPECQNVIAPQANAFVPFHTLTDKLLDTVELMSQKSK